MKKNSMIIDKAKKLYHLIEINYKYCILLVIFIMLFCAPLYVTTNFKYDEYTFDNYADDGYFIELTSGTVVKQNIETNGQIQTYGFYSYNENKSDISGSIKVEVFSNNNLIHSQTIDMKQTVNTGLVMVDIPKMDGQEASIVFSGIDGEKGSSISLYCTDKTTFGSLEQNGEADKNTSVYSNIYVKKVSSMHYIRLALLAFLLLLFIYSAFLILKKNVKFLEIKLYLVSIFMILGCLVILKPMSIITPEPFAEMPRIYFWEYREYGTKTSIFLQDAGYWPLIQRVISIFVIKIFNNEQSIGVMTVFGTVFMAVVSSRFVLPCFKKYFNPSIRFLISLFIGLLFCALPPRNELCTYINFVYASIIVIFTNYLLDFKRLKTYQFIYVCITSILMLSKGLFVAVVPLALIVIIYCIVKKQNLRMVVYSIFVCIFGLIQLAYMYLHMKWWMPQSQPLSMTIKKVIYSAYGGFANLIESFTVFVKIDSFIINIFFILAIVLLVVFCIKQMEKNKNNLIHMLTISSIITAYGTCVLIFYTVRVNECIDLNIIQIVDWFSKQMTIDGVSHIIDRWKIIGFYLFFMCIVLLIDIHAKKQRKNLYIIAIVLVLSLNFLCSSQTPLLRSYSLSNWKSYIKYVENNQYAIITNPPEYSLTKDARLVYIGDKDAKLQTGHNVWLPEEYELTCENLSGINLADFSLQDQSIISVYIKKHSLLQKGDVNVVLYDKDDNIIVQKQMEPAKDKLFLGFLFKEPVEAVNRFEFINEKGEKFSIEPEVYIGIAN